MLTELLSALFSGAQLVKVHEIGESETFWCEKAGGEYSFYVHGWGSALGTAKDRLFDVINNPEKWKVAATQKANNEG
jgi:hypothetical protein